MVVNSSDDLPSRFGLSPQAFRNEIRVLRRELFLLSRELREVVDPIGRQRLAREIAAVESRLSDRNVVF